LIFVQVALSQDGSIVAPNGAVLGVTLLDEGQQGIKKPFLDHGLSHKGILLSETGRIFTVTQPEQPYYGSRILAQTLAQK
jgi:hypothetical protein